MGYFDGLVDAGFKKDEAGNTVFYPWGVLGKGKIIPNDEAKKVLRDYLMRYMKISFVMIIFGVIVGINFTRMPILLVSLLAATAILLLWHLNNIKRITAGFEQSTAKLKMAEAYTNSAKSHNKVTLWLLLLVSIGFCLIGLVLLVSANAMGQKLIGLSLALLFGACTAAIGYMVKVKK